MSAAEPPEVGIGVIGARSMVATRAVMPAITASDRCRLAATASLSGAVPEPWAPTAVDGYEEVLAHPAVDAVYVPLPNGMHDEWTRRAAEHGKHVLCEKPLAPDVATARSMADDCTRAGVLLAEAWMTPFDPRWSTALDLVRAGTIGDVTLIDARFTFSIPSEAAENYRWRPDQGGGALLDVGIYCLGAAVELWGSDVAAIDAAVTPAPGGVDATTAAELRWTRDRVVRIRCSFVEEEQQQLVFAGSHGRLTLDGDAFTGGDRAAVIVHELADGSTEDIRVQPGDPYRNMVDAFAAAVSGDAEWPRPAERSIEMLRLIERIRDAA